MERKFDFSKVSSTYSGRHGCSCGCKGRHAYASAHVKWSSKNRGYPVKPDDVSDRSVKGTFNKVQAHYDAMTDEQFKKAVDDGWCNDGFVSFDTETRTYSVYFKTEKA